MLSDSKLPKKFWAKVLATDTYIRNWSSTNALKSMTSCAKPNVSFFKVFGCATYSHVHSDEWQKLDSKYRRCVFLGYGREVKGYCLFDLERSRVFFCRMLFLMSCHMEYRHSQRRMGRKTPCGYWKWSCNWPTSNSNWRHSMKLCLVLKEANWRMLLRRRLNIWPRMMYGI